MCSSTTSPNQHRSTQNTSFSMVTQDTGNSNVACVYCRESHYSASCPRVTIVSVCREILSKEGCCFACLMKHNCEAQLHIHWHNECQSHRKCRKCGRKYHQSLCEQHPPAQPTENNDSEETLPPTTTTTVAKTKNNILLQTAHSRAYTSDNKLVPVRILLDSGSQRSYITKSLKTRLKLVPLRQERLALNTFGNT